MTNPVWMRKELIVKGNTFQRSMTNPITPHIPAAAEAMGVHSNCSPLAAATCTALRRSI
jgi:hypothetical protein